MQELPRLALSVRQPSAWAIIHGGKEIENRTLGSIRAGRMTTGTICIHAATGMKEDEYRYLHWRFAQHGSICPRPDDLVRGAIIGVVDVVEITTASDSPWFGGEAGLLLKNPRAVDPIPAQGRLGYFEWSPGGACAPVKPWMKRYDRAGGDTDTLTLFPPTPPVYKTPPKKSWRKG
jgi:hypothetical protein